MLVHVMIDINPAIQLVLFYSQLSNCQSIIVIINMYQFLVHHKLIEYKGNFNLFFAFYKVVLVVIY